MTVASENIQVNTDLRNKLKLEKTFRPEVVSLFRRMVKDFTVRFSATGRITDASSFEGEWVGLLQKQYNRVQGQFAGSVSKFANKSFFGIGVKVDEIEEGSDDSILFAFALLKWLEEHSAESAEIITNTNQRNIEDAVDEARQNLLDEGDEFSDRDIALTAAVILKRKFSGRVGTIISFETQSSAEATKLIEAELLSGLTPSIIQPVSFVRTSTTKKWRTVGDSIVRTKPFNHRAADFQVVKITEPFIVGGQSLMHPGDVSLGASIGNTAN